MVEAGHSTVTPGPSTRRRVSFAVVAGLSFVLTAAFRFLGTTGFSNDHFVHLVAASQMLFGDWPTRDFADPGMPLMYAASATAQMVLGHTLFAEAVLVALGFAVAAVFTAATVRDLTHSVALAAVAVGLEVAIVPRSYSYPKILLYAVGFFVCGRYVRRPTGHRLLVLAIVTVVAFLFRHDHGIYLGAAGLVTALLASPNKSWGERWNAGMLFAGMVTLLLAPYGLYIAINGGLSSYVRTGMEFTRYEALREEHVWPNPFRSPDAEQAALLYVFHALPIVALITLAAKWREKNAGTTAAQVLPIIAVALLVNFRFLRNPLATRLPDAIVPAVVLGSWLTASAWRASRHRVFLRVVALIALMVASSLVLAVGHTRQEINRSGLDRPWDQIPGYFRDRAIDMHLRFGEHQMPTRGVRVLIPFFTYLDRCTTTHHRLLMTGFMPEVPFFAQRAFAGGQSTFMPGYYTRADNQRQVLNRLKTQTVPFTLIPSDYEAALDTAFPIVAPYLHARYRPLTDVQVDNATWIHILVDRDLAAVSQDPTTGWPCYR